MSYLETDRLAALVAAKCQVVDLLVTLAERQLQLAEAGETHALFKLLAAKQGVLEQLQRLEREIDPFRTQDPESRLWRTPADRAQCQRQAQQAAERLARAMTLEKQGEAAMVRRRDAAAAAIEAAQSATDARVAYFSGFAMSPAPAALQCEG